MAPAEPVIVSLPVPDLDEDESFAAARVDEDGEWHLLGNAVIDGDNLRVPAAHFSGVFGFVTDKLLRPLGDFMAHSLGGRTEPRTAVASHRGPG